MSFAFGSQEVTWLGFFGMPQKTASKSQQRTAAICLTQASEADADSTTSKKQPIGKCIVVRYGVILKSIQHPSCSLFFGPLTYDGPTQFMGLSGNHMGWEILNQDD